ARVAARQLMAGLGSEVVVLLPDGAANLAAMPIGPACFAMDDHEKAVALWAFEHGKPAGLQSDTLPGARAFYLPLRSRARTLGLLATVPPAAHRLREPEQRQLLEAFCQPVAMVLERARLAEEALAAHRRAEREELMSSLLSSVSHDLRTPLAAITGAAST